MDEEVLRINSVGACLGGSTALTCQGAGHP